MVCAVIVVFNVLLVGGLLGWFVWWFGVVMVVCLQFVGLVTLFLLVDWIGGFSVGVMLFFIYDCLGVC